MMFPQRDTVSLPSITTLEEPETTVRTSLPMVKTSALGVIVIASLISVLELIRTRHKILSASTIYRVSGST